MKNKLLKTIAISGAILLSGQANAKFVNLDVIETFGINAAGTGAADAVAMNALDYLGTSFTDTIPAEGATFGDIGAIYAADGDYGFTDADLGDYVLTTVFTDWVGVYSDVGTDDNGDGIPDSFSAEFLSGTSSWNSSYVDPVTGDATVVDTGILELSIITGVGELSVSGVTGNQTGDMEMVFRVTGAMEDYFYIDLNGDGMFTEDEDLADLLAAIEGTDSEGYYLGYVFGTNTIVDDAGQQAIIRTALEGYLETDLSFLDTLGGYVAVNDGLFYMATIPEPEMLSLMGLAVLGLAGLQRRRRKIELQK